VTVGVLVMAHGTPATPEEIEPFYTRIRRGRPPTAEQLADLRRRYEAIGGTSPLAARTAAQVAGIASRLEEEAPGHYLVRYGAKHTEPTIEAVAAEVAAAGVEGAVGLVLAPHRSSLGSEEYLTRAAGVFTDAGIPFFPVHQWFDEPGFADLLAGRVRSTLDSMGAQRPVVIFTAHSLPVRAAGTYPDQLEASAAAIVRAAGLGDGWRVAWQSAGRTPEPWLGPDLLQVLGGLHPEGFDAALVCPVGFVSDHLEVLYDLDIEARRVAQGAGLTFARTPSLNDDPGLAAILARVVRQAGRDAARVGPGPERDGRG
jgi:protoporphyrin/coproporphyrin ferrochelatase